MDLGRPFSELSIVPTNSLVKAPSLVTKQEIMTVTYIPLAPRVPQGTPISRNLP